MELEDSPVSDKALGRKSPPIKLREEVEALEKTTATSGDLRWLKEHVFQSLDRMKEIMKGMD